MSDNQNHQYRSLHQTSGGDTVASASHRIDFTLGGDLIGEFASTPIALSAGFWPYEAPIRDRVPPTTPSPILPVQGATVSSTLVSYLWTQSTDTAYASAYYNTLLGCRVAGYRLLVSRDAAFTDTVLDRIVTDTGVSPILSYGVGLTYYWHVSAFDSAGNSSPWSNSFSFTRAASLDTAPPASVVGMTARALDTGAVLVAWNASPSIVMESGYYRLAWDSGLGTENYATIETRAHTGVNTFFGHLTSVLTAGVTYSFKVTAVSGAGISDSGTIKRVIALAASVPAPALEFITPRTDKRRVDRGGGIQLNVRPHPGDAYASSLSSVRFQYRRGASGAWTDALPSSNGNRSNPADYRGSGNVGMHWDAAALTADSYELRAVPKVLSGTEYLQKAATIIIDLVTDATQSDVSSTYSPGNNKMELTEKLHGTIGETVTTSLPTQQQASVHLDSRAIPLNASGQAPKLHLALAESLPQDAGLPDSIQAAGPVVDVRFSTHEQPKSEVFVTISLGETRVKNGVLQSKTSRGWTPVSALKCYRHDGVSWTEITTYEVDSAAGVIRIRTSHFSLFRAAAPETSVVVGLTSVALETPAGTFRTRATTIEFRWTKATGDDTPTIRYRLQVAATSAFATITADTANVVETAATLTLPANATYYWRIISSDASGDSLVSTLTRLVIIDTAPPVPGAVVFPTETYAKVAARNATRLSWNAATDSDYVDSYRVQLWRTDTSGSPIADTALTAAQLQATIAALTPGTYVWRLWAADGVRNEATLGYKTFQVFRTGDVTEDGAVNAEDYFAFGRVYGTTSTTLPDLNLDGVVNLEDIRALFSGG